MNFPLGVKGHEGNIGNKESDRLAKEGAEKTDQDELELDIPIYFDLQGAKLVSLTQAKAYKGIKERKPPYSRRMTSRNLQKTRNMIEAFNRELETDSAIWHGLPSGKIIPTVGSQIIYICLVGTLCFCRSCRTGKLWCDYENY